MLQNLSLNRIPNFNPFVSMKDLTRDIVTLSDLTNDVTVIKLQDLIRQRDNVNPTNIKGMVQKEMDKASKEPVHGKVTNVPRNNAKLTNLTRDITFVDCLQNLTRDVTSISHLQDLTEDITVCNLLL